MTDKSIGFALRKAPILPFFCLALAFHWGAAFGWAEEDEDGSTGISLAEFMGLEVTSVSKRAQKRTEAAAAIYVITQEQIQRWGVTNIPDALRRVPGLNVGRIDANKWAISARGDNGRFANKLLVLIDGRSVYTPLFAGVYWEVQQVPLENIERIEIIRGPGSTLWGANAVNGVINIITRSSENTQGVQLSLTGGTEHKAGGTVQYGGKVGENTAFRAYGHYLNWDTGKTLDASAQAQDDWQLGQGGFRLDWKAEAEDDNAAPTSFTLSGDFYSGKLNQQVRVPVDPAPASALLDDETEVKGGNLVAKVDHRFSSRFSMTAQAYFDYVSRDGIVLYEDRKTFDIDVQGQAELADWNNLVFGAEVRTISDDTVATDSFALDPASRSVTLISGFVQEGLTLGEGLQLTLGSKFEHNDFTGFEIQPTARIAWTPSPRQTLWAAFSRAVRTPSRGEHDVQLEIVFPGPEAPPFPVVVQGNKDYKSEILLAFEAGFRLTGAENWSLDVAGFFNDYDRLRTLDPEIAPPPIVGLPFDNKMTGQSYGLEVDLQWQITPAWSVQGSYAYLKTEYELQDGSQSFTQLAETSAPEHQANFWTSIDLGEHFEVHGGLRFVDDILLFGQPVDSYVGLDAQIVWKATDQVRISIQGRDLQKEQHLEHIPNFILSEPSLVERSVVASARISL